MILGKVKDKSGTPILLRAPKIGDAKEMAGFINSLVKENAYILMYKKISVKFEKEWLKNTLKAAKKRELFFVLAERSGKIVGIANFSRGRYRKRHVAELGVSVHNNARKLGIATILINEISRQAKRQGVKILVLGVFPQNKPAIGLYKKLGFKKYGVMPRGLTIGKNFVDEILMYKRP